MPDWVAGTIVLTFVAVFGFAVIYGWLRFDTYLNRRLEEAE